MRQLSDWLNEYMQLNQQSESPDLFHFWTGVSVIAAALKQKCYIDEIKFKWIPNFYIVLVAPPGIATKSTTIRIGQDIASKLTSINIGPDSMTWQSLIKFLEEHPQPWNLPNGTQRTISPVTFFSSELGATVDLTDERMLTILTDLWDGKEGDWLKTTRTAGNNTVPWPYINMIACTTMQGIESLPKNALMGGFMSRTLMVHAHDKKQLIPYPSEVIQAAWYHDLKTKLIHDLEDISLMNGPFLLSKEAREFGVKWYDRHHLIDYRKHEDDEAAQNVLARAQTQIHKISMILSASRSSNMEITKKDLERAVKAYDETTLHSLKIVQKIASSNGQDRALHLEDVVLKTGNILKTELYGKVVHQMGYKEFQEALISLNQAGRIQEVSVGTKVYIQVFTKAKTAYP